MGDFEQPLSAKKKGQLSAAMMRTSEWIFSQEIPSDIIVHVGDSPFSLHKFPLVSKCGYIRKLVSDSNGADPAIVEVPGIPGGAESFELAAKFCYGINFEMTIENIAMLRCAAEFLEMTEEYAVGNLVTRTEAFLNEVALKSLASSVSILHSAEGFLPLAEDVKLVGRCLDTIAYIACKDNEFSSQNGANSAAVNQPKAAVDWWAEDLTMLRIDLFQRVLIAMLGRGFKQISLGPILMLYVQKSLRGLEIFGKTRKKIEPRQEHEKRVVLETIVSLLPREHNSLSVSFLSMLLRASIQLGTTVACRIDLEKRIGSQLDQAVLDDLLIPSFCFTGDTVFDVETIKRVMMHYLDYEMEEKRHEYGSSQSNSDQEKVGKLMENYLAEIASDRNLSVSKFISIAELIPERSRITEDGMYRAIDIFLKAHPDISDMDRKKVCSVMDCQKLSREACAHAAQNDRLPVQTVVQVLYHEQQRLRGAMDGTLREAEPPGLALKAGPQSTDHHLLSNPAEISSLRKENQDLKLELLKLKTRMREFERSSSDKSYSTSPLVITLPSAEKPPLPRKSFISSVSKKLGKINPFILAPNAKARTKPPKDRRHSIS